MPILETHCQVTKRLHVTNMQKLHDYMHNCISRKKGRNRTGKQRQQLSKAQQMEKRGDEKKRRVLRCKELCASPAWGRDAI